MIEVALVVGAYLVGIFPTAALVGRRQGFDPSAAGSGNPGATNAFRLGGRSAGALVLLGDLVKGAVPAGVGWLVGGRSLALACGLGAVAGHIAPVTRRLRGGKGVATGAGVVLVVEPIAFTTGAVAFGLAVAATRKAAVGSLVGTIVAFVTVIVLGRPWWELAALAGLAVLIVVRHRDNLERLRRGEEEELDHRGRTAPP